eukprot:UC1_evm1s1181
MADTTYWYSYLNTPSDEQVLEFILSQYETLYNDYVAARHLIPKGNLHEVRYEDLDTDPVGEIHQLYSALGIEEFDNVRGKIEAYVAGLGRFKKNKHTAVSEAMRTLIQARWGDSFKEFGYQP